MGLTSVDMDASTCTVNNQQQRRVDLSGLASTANVFSPPFTQHYAAYVRGTHCSRNSLHLRNTRDSCEAEISADIDVVDTLTKAAGWGVWRAAMFNHFRLEDVVAKGASRKSSIN
jgi:hypothetical protein